MPSEQEGPRRNTLETGELKWNASILSKRRPTVEPQAEHKSPSAPVFLGELCPRILGKRPPKKAIFYPPFGNFQGRPEPKQERPRFSERESVGLTFLDIAFAHGGLECIPLRTHLRPFSGK
jgi:hypothetical protein